jgi:hypothetical protein
VRVIRLWSAAGMVFKLRLHPNGLMSVGLQPQIVGSDPVGHREMPRANGPWGQKQVARRKKLMSGSGHSRCSKGVSMTSGPPL